MTGTSLTFFPLGSQKQQEFVLPDIRQGQQFKIGSSTENDLVLNDPDISPQHALLLLDPLGFFILDLNSAYGVILNGQRIPSNEWVSISSGDILQFGNTVCNFTARDDNVPSATQVVSQTPIPPINQYQNLNMPVIAQPMKKRRSPFVIVGGILLAVAVVGALLYWLGPTLLKNIGNNSLVSNVFAGEKNTSINADGQTYTDSSGVSVILPAGAIHDTTAQLSGKDIPGDLAEELKEGYQILSPAYSLEAVGQTDGSAPGLLAFPADQEGLLLLALVDGFYVAELDVDVENGKLSIPIDVHPQETGTLGGENPMWQQGTIQYILAKSKTAISGRPVQSRKWANRVSQTTPYSCFSLVHSRCWQNGNGSVQLMMDKDISLTPAQSNIVITYIQTIMDKYEALGFDGAIYTASNPVQVVVTKGSGTPHYQVTNGVIYLPNDIASKIASGGKDDFLVHEMAHWIQDESYNMTSAYYFEADTWWLETAAENMVMLVDPVYVSTNLSAYGQIDADEKISVLQSAPYQWPMGEFYVQAQQVKVNMCANAACPISQDSFVKAINNGTYPFSDEALKTKLHGNLPDYARYLLGLAPEMANASIPLNGVVSGEGYGDYVVLKRTVRSALDMKDQSGFGRLFAEEKAGQTGLRVEAGLQKDGVYVLRVEVASADMSPQWPAALYIEAGAPYYYRLNDGEIQYNDGKKELVIQPLMSASDGAISKVRIVALGQTGGEVFKAHVGPADLSGMWVLELSENSQWINQLSCDQMDETSIVSDWAIPTTSFLLIFGDFISDPASGILTWTPKSERVSILPESIIERSDTSSNSSFTAEAAIAQGVIHLNLNSFTPEDTTFEVRPEAYSTQFISLPGTISMTVDLDHLQYVGIEETVASGLPGFLVWELSGENLVYTLDSDLLVQDVNQSAQLEKETRNHCSGIIEVPGTIKIYQIKQ